MAIHITLSNKEIEYDDRDPVVAAFLQRVRELAAKPKSKESDLIALVYSQENPIMDRTLFPERGAVTKEVLEHPVYRVLCDIMGRKRVEQDSVNVETLGASYTLTVAEAAAKLGMTTSAVRQAIDASRLPSWKKGGHHFLNPDHFSAFKLGTAGPKKRVEPTIGQALALKFGHAPGVSLRVSVEGNPAVIQTERAHGNVQDGTVVAGWTHVYAIASIESGRGISTRYFELEPSHEMEEVNVGHEMFIKGRFRIAETKNNPQAAAAAWRARSR